MKEVLKLLHMKFLPSSIIFLQADHVYIRIFLADGRKILHRSSLSSFFRQLDPNKFLRTHRSYVVNLDYVVNYSPAEVRLGEHEIPISRARKGQVLGRLSRTQ